MTENFEKKDKKDPGFEKVDLTIEEPTPGVHDGYQISYEGNTKEQCTAYNVVISEIDKEKNLGLFHQDGVANEPDTSHGAGYHCWEVLGSGTTGEQLQELFPEIHQRAEEKYKKYKEMGLM